MKKIASISIALLAIIPVFSQQAGSATKEHIKKTEVASPVRRPEKDLFVYQTDPRRLVPVEIEKSELAGMPEEQEEKLKKAAAQYPHSVKIIND